MVRGRFSIAASSFCTSFTIAGRELSATVSLMLREDSAMERAASLPGFQGLSLKSRKAARQAHTTTRPAATFFQGRTLLVLSHFPFSDSFPAPVSGAVLKVLSVSLLKEEAAEALSVSFHEGEAAEELSVSLLKEEAADEPPLPF